MRCLVPRCPTIVCIINVDMHVVYACVYAVGACGVEGGGGIYCMLQHVGRLLALFCICNYIM